MKSQIKFLSFLEKENIYVIRSFEFGVIPSVCAIDALDQINDARYVAYVDNVQFRVCGHFLHFSETVGYAICDDCIFIQFKDKDSAMRNLQLNACYLLKKEGV